MVPPMMLRKWRELFPNASGVVKPIILRKNIFIVKHSAMDARRLATLYSSKCPEKRPPKAKGGESKKSRRKKKRKPGGIHSIEETETVAEPVDKTPG